MLISVDKDSITWKEVYNGLSAIHGALWYVKDTCLQDDRRVHRILRGRLEGADSPV